MNLKKIIKKISLQWRLTLMAAGVTAAACISLGVVMGKSANSGMDEISAFYVEAGPGWEEAPLDSIEIAPECTDLLQDTKDTFQLKSFFAMGTIIFAAGLITYFIAGKALGQLKDFCENIENVQAKNLSQPLEYQDMPREVARLSYYFNKLLERLSGAFEAQRQFSANAAHELRTPLAVMQAKIEVFQKTEAHSGEEYQELLDMLSRQLESLSKLVNELLEMTGLHTAERTDRISLRELTEEILMDLEAQAEEKKVQLIQEPGNALLVGNETLVYRAVFNLVENAIKYNIPGGCVTVSLSQEEKKAVLMVADTGTGIPVEYREQIFDPFFRVDKSRSREMGGAGIGLAMVKTIAELHQGRVYVKDSTCEGSRIILEFSTAGQKLSQEI